MVWQKLFKNPMLVIGIIMFGLFITQGQTQNWWQRYKARFIPSDCLTLLSNLSTHKDLSKYSYECKSKNLYITIDINSATQDLDSLSKVKQYTYRQIANNLKKISQISNPETIRLIPKIYIIIEHSKLSVHSYGTGQDIGKMKLINNKKSLIDFIESNIKIKELVK